MIYDTAVVVVKVRAAYVFRRNGSFVPTIDLVILQS
jgi:hypothetical protein